MLIQGKFSIASKLVLWILILAACNPGTSIATPTSRVAITINEAIELATEQCRFPHFVLIGEPLHTRAELMSRSDAEKWTFPEQPVEDIQNLNEPAWLVQIQGEFQLQGGPPPETGTQPTPSLPAKGSCWVIIDAKTGEILGLQSKSN